MPQTLEEMSEKQKQFFNDGAEGWMDRIYRNPETGRHDLHQKAFDRLFAMLPLKPGDHVLDAGCGSGVLVPMVLERITPSGILYELDFAEKMIEVNRNHHKEENIRFLVADAEQAPLEDASCDVVVCFSCFPHFHDKQAAVRTFCRILKPGGSLVVSHFDSREDINKRHASCREVMHDHLPDQNEMRYLVRKAALDVTVFIDEPGFYCMLARKR